MGPLPTPPPPMDSEIYIIKENTYIQGSNA